MLKKIRVIVSILIFTLITFYFLDFAGILPDAAGWLVNVQFIPALMIHSLIIIGCWIVLTLLFGRFYCSTLCPMGVFQDIVAWFSKRFRKRKYKYSPPKTVLRWSVLSLSFVCFILGATLIWGLFEPYSAYGRVVANIFKPIYLAGNNLLERLFSYFGNYTFYRMEIVVHSLLALGIALITLLGIGLLSWLYGRSWCNTACPVGTLLGLASRYSLLGIRLDQNKCIGCGACERKCKASCIDSQHKTVDKSRCVDCFNCIGSCRFDALHYGISPNKRKKNIGSSGLDPVPADKQPADASKRRFLLTAMSTAIAVPQAIARKNTDRINRMTDSPADHRQHPIAPPGAQSYHHLNRHCTSCHLCVSKCPANIIKPACMEYGIGGMMQPTLYFEKGFCNYDCTICGDVCPNGAIKPLSKEEKHLTQTGYVVFVPNRCIVVTDGTSCGACSEHCPTQAVAMVPYKEGLTIPKVDKTICVGCGGCEFICPARPLRAIFVEGHPEQQQRKAFDDGEQKEVILDDFGF